MGTETLTVEPQLLRWARERASLGPDELAHKVSVTPERVREWEATGKITFHHLEKVASKTYTPLGFLLLSTPPTEALPVSDFRTVGPSGAHMPSPDLLETITLCQERQDWYRDYLVAANARPLPFVGSASLMDRPADTAQEVRETIGFKTQQRVEAQTYDAALNEMVGLVESARILVMRNGVVGNNTHRKLDVNEFRGFALSDQFAPLIFINNADATAAKSFTLVHELAHIWLGQSAVSDVKIDSQQASERFCNAVAAEVLVPQEELRDAWESVDDELALIERVARKFKVSSLVVLIRAREAGLLPRTRFDAFYEEVRARPREEKRGGGGDFYRTQFSRLGREFPRAIIESTLEGRTLYKDAYRLLGVKKSESFHRLAARLGVVS